MTPADPDHLQAIKARLADVAGIDKMSVTMVGGRLVFAINGKTIGLDPFAGDDEIETAIRLSLSAVTAAPEAAPAPIATPMPAPAAATPAATKATPMSTTPPAPGSFAASIRAMMDEARAGVAKARSDGLAKVGEAVSKLNDAKAATAHVSATMAQSIEDEAAAVLSELGQISNDLGGS